MDGFFENGVGGVVGADDHAIESSKGISRKMVFTGFSFFRRGSADIADLVDGGLEVAKTLIAKPSIYFFTADALTGEEEVEEEIFEGGHEEILNYEF